MDIEIIGLDSPLWLIALQKLRHDIYHLPAYVNLEAKRTKSTPEAIAISENDKIFFLPYLWRSCADLFGDELPEVFDVVSPYGYPGFLLSEAAANAPEFLNLALDTLTEVWRDRLVYSAFLRLHPLLNPEVKNKYIKVNGETVSIDLKLKIAEILHDTRPEHRNKINRCKRAGFTATMVPFKQYINEFNLIYEQTMERVGAARAYFFGEYYFKELAESLENHLHLCIVELNDKIACSGLFSECCGIVQYHLGGTNNEFLPLAPSKLMFDYVRFWAKERGNEVFHLGGGVGGAKDSLYHFKAGFSKQRHTFLTLRLIPDEIKYRRLVELRAKYLHTEVETLLKTDFFPAYRALNI